MPVAATVTGKKEAVAKQLFVYTINRMRISFDPAKRDITLKERGLDFLDAAWVFAGRTFEFPDLRKDYGESRILCIGELQGRMVVVGYVQRGDTRHVFSMRKANEREKAAYQKRLEQA